VNFNAFSEAYKDYKPIYSEVTELNPNDEKVVHVKPTHKDLKDDPNATPLKVHYGKINHFYRNDPANPHLKHHYEYAGEYDTPDETAPPGAEPSKKIDPQEHHAKALQREEAVKFKTEGIKKHLEGGDIVEFYTQDPLTKKLKVEIGSAYNLSPTEPQGGLKGGKGAKNNQQPQEINHIAVQTEDGYHEVPLDQIKRFGKYIVDELHMYSFDPKNLKWKRDMDSATGVKPADEESAVAKPAHTPGEIQVTHIPEPQSVTASPTATVEDPHPDPFKNEPHPDMPPAHPLDPKKTISDAGGMVLDDDEDNIYFTHPDTQGIFSIAKDKVTPQTVSEQLGKKLSATQQEQPEAAAGKPVFDPTQHWTYKLPEEVVPHIRGLIDQIDKVREKGMQVPASILAARHNLLTNQTNNGALRAAAELENFIKNPMQSMNPPIKPPAKLEDFTEKLGVPPTDPEALKLAPEKLAGTKSANLYLQKKQADALKALKEYAKTNGLDDTAGEFKTDLNKDNRNLIDFYRLYLKNAATKKHPDDAVAPLNINIPTDEQIAHGKHLSDISDYMQNEKLDIPAYRNKLTRLNYLLETEPDSPLVHKYFNDLHNYVYDRGENDPYYQVHKLQQEVKDKYAKKLSPGLLNQLENRFINVEEGNVDPEQALDKTTNQLSAYGIKLPPPEEMQYDRSTWAKSKLDDLFDKRKMMSQQKKITQDMQQLEQEIKGSENGPPMPKTNQQATIPEGPKLSPDSQKSQKQLSGLMQDIQKQVDAYNYIKENGTHPEFAGMDKAILQWIEEQTNKYNQIGQTVAEQSGMPFEPFKPKLAKEKSSKESQGPDTDQLIANHLDSVDAQRKVWLRGALEGQKHKIKNERKHFLSFAQNFSPTVQADIQNINAQMSEKLDSNDWTPLAEGLAHTPQGKKFVQILNQHVQTAENQQKLAGMVAEEAYKSLQDTIAAEKTLVRRDISLSLRKSFYNDKSSPEQQQATNLLAAYFDDFIDTVMNKYKYIPVPVRKSILRTLLKSMIKDIIRDNEFSATMMREDYTAPLDDNIIKSIGQEVATIVTSFRMEAEPDKTFLIIDLSKAKKRAPHVIERELVNLKKFASGLRPIHPNQKIQPEEWSEKLKTLEGKMVQAKLIPRRISAHRMEKFIMDNDNRTLAQFYNENLKELNERLQATYEDE
jgi:hypothetical protein